jgi:AAA domain, putative AbiEii toxin, Type IV TA system
MRIECTSPFGIILPFKLTQPLPDLIVLVGVNGSGKTQFLRGLFQGRINAYSDLHLSDTVTEDTSAESENSNRIDTDRIRLIIGNQDQSREQFTSPSERQRQEQFNSQSNVESLSVSFDTRRNLKLRPFFEELDGISGARLKRVLQLQDPFLLSAIEVHSLLVENEILVELEEVNDLYRRAEQAVLEEEYCEATVRSNRPLPGTLTKEVCYKNAISPLKVTGRMATGLSLLKPFSAFSQPLVEIFTEYRDSYWNNRIRRLRAEDGEAIAFYSNCEFESAFGRPPWEALNALIGNSLPYEVVPPHREPGNAVTLGFKHKQHDLVVGLGNLSDGEQTLLKFALSVFEGHRFRAKLQMPKLLLLDETDAPLHPKMVLAWLNIIKNGLVNDRGVNCILATHSPTTVALAPEGSVYEIDKDNAGLLPLTKQKALNKLTIGIPTHALSFSDRRHVFTESVTDARIYDSLFQTIGPSLSRDYSLNFLPVGFRKSNSDCDSIKQEVGGGCDQVRAMVRRMSEQESTSIYGAIDWDAHNEPSERVSVVGYGEFYCLDNILFHPVLIGSYLLERKVSIPKVSFQFDDLALLPEADLSHLSKSIIDLMKFPEGFEHAETTVNFFGGFDITTPKGLLQVTKRQLKEIILPINESLQGCNKQGEGAISLRIAETVVKRNPRLCPTAIVKLFENLTSP